METELRNAIRKLLEEKTVDVAIGYGRVGVGGAVGLGVASVSAGHEGEVRVVSAETDVTPR